MVDYTLYESIIVDRAMTGEEIKIVRENFELIKECMESAVKRDRLRREKYPDVQGDAIWLILLGAFIAMVYFLIFLTVMG